MFGFAPRNLHDCERVTRRGLLQIGSLTGLGLSLPTLLAAKNAAAIENKSPRHIRPEA